MVSIASKSNMLLKKNFNAYFISFELLWCCSRTAKTCGLKREELNVKSQPRRDISVKFRLHFKSSLNSTFRWVFFLFLNSHERSVKSQISPFHAVCFTNRLIFLVSLNFFIFLLIFPQKHSHYRLIPFIKATN